jgi:hydroxymethylbilane synthase
MNSDDPLRVGTRSSPLAIVQSRMVAAAIAGVYPDKPAPEIVPLITTGDAVQDRPLRDVGGKGLFTKELDAALVDGRIDIAVHSMKDVETQLAPGIVVDCLFPREDARDALITGPSISASNLAELPPGCRFGTSSLRRAALVSAMRPDIEIVGFRGNVDTRLAKLAAGEADATLLAVAGLNRLGRADEIGTILTPEEMLPAVGQGAVGVACRAGDARVAELLHPLHDFETGLCVASERAMLAELDGSCHTPIGGLAQIRADAISLRAILAAPDGSKVFRAEQSSGHRSAVSDLAVSDLAVSDLAISDLAVAVALNWPRPGRMNRLGRMNRAPDEAG